MTLLILSKFKNLRFSENKIKKFFLSIGRALIYIIAPKRQLDVFIYIFLLSVASLYLSSEISSYSDKQYFSTFYRTENIRNMDAFIAKNDLLHALYYGRVPIQPSLFEQALTYYEMWTHSPLNTDLSKVSNFNEYINLIGEQNFSNKFKFSNEYNSQMGSVLVDAVKNIDTLEKYLMYIQGSNIMYAIWLGFLSIRKPKKFKKLFDPNTPWF